MRTQEYNEVYYKMLGAGFDEFVAREAALFYPTTVKRMFRESEERFERKLAKKRGRCRTCGAVTEGLKIFCQEHEFTEKTGFDPHTFNMKGER